MRLGCKAKDSDGLWRVARAFALANETLPWFYLGRRGGSWNVQEAGDRDANSVVAVIDPSCHKDVCGWPIRNLVLAAPTSTIKVACIRRAQDECMLISLEVVGPRGPLEVTGWERNEKGVVAPKTVDLSSLMDPKQCFLFGR